MPALPPAITTLRTRIQREPELRFTPGGKAVLKFSVPIEDRRKNEATGKWDTKSRQWIDITFWDEQAERLAGLPAHTPVLIQGSLYPETYLTKAQEEKVAWKMTNPNIGLDLTFCQVTAAEPGIVTLTWTDKGHQQHREQPKPTGLEGQVGKSWDQDQEMPF